jgi:hypothetical protein
MECPTFFDKAFAGKIRRRNIVRQTSALRKARPTVAGLQTRAQNSIIKKPRLKGRFS